MKHFIILFYLLPEFVEDFLVILCSRISSILLNIDFRLSRFFPLWICQPQSLFFTFISLHDPWAKLIVKQMIILLIQLSLSTFLDKLHHSFFFNWTESSISILIKHLSKLVFLVIDVSCLIQVKCVINTIVLHSSKAFKLSECFMLCIFCPFWWQKDVFFSDIFELSNHWLWHLLPFVIESRADMIETCLGIWHFI